MGARNVLRECVRYVLQLLLLVTVGLFLVYLSAISLNAWWLSRAQEVLGERLNFPYLSPYVAKRFDKADKYFAFPLSEDLALAVWAFWGLTLVASLLALALKALPPHTPDQPVKHGRLPKRRLTDAVYRIAQYELGPRQFWWWWCGGLKVYDAVMVALWFALNILCVQQRVCLELPRLQETIRRSGGVSAGWTGKMAYLGTVSGALGWAATLDIMLMFFPVPRSTFLHWLLGTTFPAFIKYHRWLGHGTVAILTLHGWGYWALWLWEGIYPRGLYWDAYGSNMLSGGLSWGAGAALWFTSLSFIRRKYFEVFYRTHIIAFVAFMVFGFIHHYQLWAYTMPGLILYLLDVTFRIAQQAYPVRLRVASVHDKGQLATLQFDMDPLTPQDPIQEVYVSSNGISRLQWHPFTTIPGEQPFSMVSIIKQYGKWTGQLMDRLRDGEMTVRVDGPYGDSGERPAWLQHPVLVVFAGGIGVTPVLGIIQDLNRRRQAAKKAGQHAEGQVPTHVHLFFSARAQPELDLLQSDIISEARTLGWLIVDLYLSGRQHAESALAKAPPSPMSTSSADSDSGKPQRYARTTLPPYHFGNLHWACAHVAAFAGAVLGGVGTWAYAVKGKTVHHPRGVQDWTIGAVLAAASGLGCMVGAALVIAPAHIFHSMRMRKLSREGKGGTPNQAAEGINEGDIEKSYMKLPKAHMGRPPVHNLLASLCEQHAAEASIGVIAAGPQKMVESVALACSSRNDKLGLRGTPYLDVKQYTYSL